MSSKLSSLVRFVTVTFCSARQGQVHRGAGRLHTRTGLSRTEPLGFHEIDLIAGGFGGWFSGGSRAPVEHYRVDRDSIVGNSGPRQTSVATVTWLFSYLARIYR